MPFHVHLWSHEMERCTMTPTTIIDACFAGYETNVATWFLWCRTLGLHVISNFLIRNRCYSDACKSLYYGTFQMFLFCLHERIWRRESLALLSSRFTHTFSHLVIHCHPSHLHFHHKWSACVWFADETDKNAAIKPYIEFNEGRFWTVSINPHDSVLFVLHSVTVAICIGWCARAKHKHKSMCSVDRSQQFNSIRFENQRNRKQAKIQIVILLAC